jgi:hypothetical protein
MDYGKKKLDFSNTTGEPWKKKCGLMDGKSKYG